MSSGNSAPAGEAEGFAEVREQGRPRAERVGPAIAGQNDTVYLSRRRKGITPIDCVSKMSPRRRSIREDSRGRMKRRSKIGSR